MKSSRRHFLTTLGVTAGASLVRKSLFNIDKVLAQGPYTRPNLANLTLNSPVIQSYIAGIQAMQALPANNPLSWTYQAAIHGTSMNGPNFNQCSHHAFEINLFWAWHRMYLYWFERIVRSQSGDPTFALPFWDWQANPLLPSMFQNPPTGSPTLNVPAPNRNANINNGTQSVDPNPGSLTTGVNSAFAQPIFEQTIVGGNPVDGADQLIQYPHDQVHGIVGAPSTLNGPIGWMGSILTAAQDPVFFAHHANIDRLWDLWLANNALNADPTSDAAWGGTTFTFFDENGNAVTMTPCDVLRAAQQLNYQYEGEPAQVNQYCGNPQPCTVGYQVLIGQCISKPPFYLKPKKPYGYYTFPISYSLEQEIYGYLQNPYNTIYLGHYGVTCPTQPGVAWDVYVGLPKGQQPSHSSPYYVGSYAMYGAGIKDQPPDGNDPADYNFNVNTALAAALKKLRKGGKIPVTFYPIIVPGTKQKATLSIEGAQLTLQTVTPSGRAGKKPAGDKTVARVIAGR